MDQRGGRTEILDCIDGIFALRLLMGRAQLRPPQGAAPQAVGMTPSVAAKMRRRAASETGAVVDQQEQCNRCSHFQKIGTRLWAPRYMDHLARHDTDLDATMTDWFKNNGPIAGWWVALIAVSAIVFAVSRSTEFAQFGIGLLSASLALLAAMAIFEVIWQLAAKGPSDGGGSGKSRPRGP